MVTALAIQGPGAARLEPDESPHRHGGSGDCHILQRAEGQDVS